MAFPRINRLFARVRPVVVYRSVVFQIRRRPYISFLVSLILLFGLILIGNYFFKPKTETVKSVPQVKQVKTFKIGSVPQVAVAAQVEKTGVVKIVALTPGIVSAVNVSEGQSVGKGANLINIAANYSLSDPSAIQSAIASQQYNLARDTFDNQKDIINKQRDVANKTDENAADLRDIANQSISDTNSVIDLNQQILDTMNQNIQDLEASSSASTNPALLQAKQLKSQLESAQLQLKSSQRNLQFQAASDKPPAQLADLQRDITLKQLDNQEKSLGVNLEIARLQLSIAAINAATFHPTAPFAGVIDRVFAKVGQMVSPGTPLVQLSGNNQTETAVAKVPQTLAVNISNFEPSTVVIDNQNYDLFPKYISTQATDGNLYSVIFDLNETGADLTDSQFITIKLPVGLPDSGAAIPFIPLDSVFQTQNQNLVNVVENGQVSSRQVSLGKVIGEYVEVTSGLHSGDQVILNRNVISGDKIQVI